MTDIPEITLKRIHVLDLRIRLEKAVASAFDRACQPVQLGRQDKIYKRAAFILTLKDPESDLTDGQYRLRLVRHVYAKSSDVLHGRLSMVNIPQTVIDEWRAIVEDLEKSVPPS